MIAAFFNDHKSEQYTLEEWTELMRTEDILITSNASEIPTERVLNAQQMAIIIEEECTWKHVVFEPAGTADVRPDGDFAKLAAPLVPVFEKTYPDGGTLVLSVPLPATPAPTPATVLSIPKAIPLEDWRKNFRRDFDAIASKPPVSQLVTTEDGSPIRIDFDFRAGEAPTLRTNLYVCRTVGRQIAWVAQRERDRDVAGWRVLLLPWARDKAMEKLDLSLDCGYVQEIRIVKTTYRGDVLLAEVTKWA